MTADFFLSIPLAAGGRMEVEEEARQEAAGLP